LEANHSSTSAVKGKHVSTPQPLTFGDVHNHDDPLAIVVHGFPDTPYTWRHLGPQLAGHGYRVVAPWLPGYGHRAAGPISVGTYVRHLLATYQAYHGDHRALLVGHDWGANAAYGVVSVRPEAFGRLITLAVPPTAALGEGMLSYAQLRRSFYVWLIQQVGLAEVALLREGFWEALWSDWSPGYDAHEDVARLRTYVNADTLEGVISPYRSAFNPDYVDAAATAEAEATVALPSVPTLNLHGATDGAIGADLLTDVTAYLPAPGSAFQMIGGVGHFLHLEEPEIIWGNIKAWLDGAP
jgi:pimeloyl-ACP methyl ester carboxylesterase